MRVNEPSKSKKENLDPKHCPRTHEEEDALLGTAKDDETLPAPAETIFGRRSPAAGGSLESERVRSF